MKIKGKALIIYKFYKLGIKINFLNGRNESNMKDKKVLVISITVIVLIAIAIIVGIVIGNMPKEKPEEVLSKYFALINDKKYDEMYEMISSTSKDEISKEEFVKRNKNIYEGIDGKITKINVNEKTKENKKEKILYDEELLTSAGTVKFSNSVSFTKEEKEYKLDWKSELIFPELKDEYKVKVETLKGKRGSILDREENPIAYDGKISSVGIVPRKIRRK